MAAKSRYFELDLLRFVAAFAVLTFHFTFRGWALDQLSDSPFPRLGCVTRYGYLGVQLFFIISGFVILLTAQSGSMTRFVISRVVRLYPAYWFCVSLTAACILLLSDERFRVTFGQYAANLTMLHSFVGIRSVDTVYWSLVVELKFYFLVCVVLMVRLLPRTQVLLYLWLLLTIGLRLGILPAKLGFFFIPESSPYFIAGATFFLVRNYGMSLGRATLLLLSGVLGVWFDAGQANDMSAQFGTTFSPVVTGIIIGGFFVMFLLFSLNRLTWLNCAMWIEMGALTYPLYLIHQVIGYMVVNRLHGVLPDAAALAVTTAIVLGIAWSVHRWIEVPVAPRLKGLLESIARRVVQPALRKPQA